MNPVPRVLFINHSIRDGGPGKSLFYILKFLDRTRLIPYVLIPKDDVFSDLLRAQGIYENIITDARFPENLKRPRFKTVYGHDGAGNFSSYYDKYLHILSILLNMLDLISLVITSPFLIKKKRIDIIYCNGTQAKIVGALMGIMNGCPVIWHVRNIQQTRLLRAIINTLARLPAVRRIICVSNAAADQFRHGRENVIVIHNGIDECDYDSGKTRDGEIRSAFGLSEDTVIVGSAGRIVPRKGYELLIRAASTVMNNGLGKKGGSVRFVIVGDTPYFFRDDHLSKLKRLVADEGLDEYFIFTGFINDVRPCLKDFDIFVVPSNYPDPSPRSVIEAMSFELPVVGFRVGGIVESVDDGVTGILCEPGDVVNMGRSILRLIEDADLRRSMGMRGRNRVIKNFSANAVTSEIERNILEVCR